MAVAYDSASQFLVEGVPEVDSGSWTHTIGGSVSNGYVFVWCANVNSVAIGASNPVTVNGVAATQIAGPLTNSYGLQMYVYGAPTGSTTGAITISVTWTANVNNNTWAAWAASVSGANQSPTWTSGTNVKSATANTGGTDHPSVTITVPTNGLTLTGISGHFDGAITQSTGTSVYTYSDGSLAYGLSYGTATTQTWNVAGDNSCAMYTVAMDPSGGTLHTSSLSGGSSFVGGINRVTRKLLAA